MKTRPAMFVLSALLLVAVAAGCGSEEDGPTGPDTILDRGDGPEDPSLCEPACRALTGLCATHTVDIDIENEQKPDIDLMRACMRECESGGFEEEELECLAEVECSDFNVCL